MQYLIVFGATSPHPVCNAVLEQIPRHCSVAVLPSDTHDLSYHDVAMSVEEAVSDIATGVLSSAVFRPANGPLRYALILPPNFNAQPLSFWSGTFEWTSEEWRSSWDVLLRRSDLSFISVGRDESPDLSNSDVNNENSPVWRSSPTIVTALRFPTRDWTIISNEGQGM